MPAAVPATAAPAVAAGFAGWGIAAASASGGKRGKFLRQFGRAAVRA